MSKGTRHGMYKHGLSGMPEYQAWVALRHRCLSRSGLNWQNYGSRGISFCDRWASFDNFLSDMGRKPSPGHSLDRIDNDGNYEPANCRWATRSEQMKNRRNAGMARGERHPRCTISDKTVMDIRAAWILCKASRIELVRQFGVSKSSVCKILANQVRAIDFAA